MAEVDGNRTRQTGVSRLGRFEGGGAHQVPRHLRNDVAAPIDQRRCRVRRRSIRSPSASPESQDRRFGGQSRDCVLGREGRQRNDGDGVCDGVGRTAGVADHTGRPRWRLRHRARAPEPTGPGVTDWMASRRPGRRARSLGSRRSRRCQADPPRLCRGGRRSVVTTGVDLGRVARRLVDAGSGAPPIQLHEIADLSLLVIRPCYLAYVGLGSSRCGRRESR